MVANRQEEAMHLPPMVAVLYLEPDPDGPPAPTQVLGVFRDDDLASAKEHAQARAGLLLGAHCWHHHDAEPALGMRQRWECYLGRHQGTAVIEPHALEPVPTPPRFGRTRRAR